MQSTVWLSWICWKKFRWKQFYCIWKLWQMVAHVFQARPVHAGSCVVTRSFGWSRWLFSKNYTSLGRGEFQCVFRLSIMRSLCASIAGLGGEPSNLIYETESSAMFSSLQYECSALSDMLHCAPEAIVKTSTIFVARDSSIALYAIARPSVRLFVCQMDGS